MTFPQWTISVLCIALLSGCDDGGSNKDTPSASYTGNQTLAALNTSNALEYLRILYSLNVRTPSLSFRSTQDITLAKNDFLRDQEKMLHHLKQKALSTQYQQRSVTTTDVCENNGTITITGNVEGSSTGALDFEYNNCRYGDHILNGRAKYLIYATNGSFQEVSSSTLTYQGTQVTPVSSGEAFNMTGTLNEVFDYGTGSIRARSYLYQQTISTGKQTLIDTERQYTAYDSTVEMTGAIYNGHHGQAKVNTLQPLFYNDSNAPVAGVTLLQGAANSKIKITSLGEQYSPDSDENLIMLQVQLDADGDGIYENITQINGDAR